jgi:hypothetical protein
MRSAASAAAAAVVAFTCSACMSHSNMHECSTHNSQTLIRFALVLLLVAVQLAHAACPTLTVDFFPSDTENVPEGWTRAAQVAAGNEDTSSLNTISLTAKPAPKLYVQPVHPLFSRGACVPSDCLGKSGRRLAGYDSSSSSSSSSRSLQNWSLQLSSSEDSSSSSSAELELLAGTQRLLLGPCMTTVAVTAAYDVLYNIDGGIDKKATMPKQGPPYISLTTLDTLAPVSRLFFNASFQYASHLQISQQTMYIIMRLGELVRGCQATAFAFVGHSGSGELADAVEAAVAAALKAGLAAAIVAAMTAAVAVGIWGVDQYWLAWTVSMHIKQLQ